MAKQCRHERSQTAQIELIEGLTVCGQDIDRVIIKPVYYCRDCGVLFVDFNKERFEKR